MQANRLRETSQNHGRATIDYLSAIWNKETVFVPEPYRHSTPYLRPDGICASIVLEVPTPFALSRPTEPLDKCMGGVLGTMDLMHPGFGQRLRSTAPVSFRLLPFGVAGQLRLGYLLTPLRGVSVHTETLIGEGRRMAVPRLRWA